MKLGYNTNGLPHHRWEEALQLIAETGYESVALTVDHHCLSPFSSDWQRTAEEVREHLRRHRLSCVIETGARFLLNPRLKHEPTLLSPDKEHRQRRIDFLRYCVDLAAFLQAEAVSFWSGILRDPVPRTVALQRLTEGCRQVIDYAAEKNVRLGFEPEPGMFIEKLADFAELRQYCPAEHFGLTMDIGHVHCVEEGEIADHLHRWGPLIFNVHIEDMRRGVHEHLPFGKGEIDFPPVLSALQVIGYPGGVHVELSRHGHVAPQMLRESYRFLQGLLQQQKQRQK